MKRSLDDTECDTNMDDIATSLMLLSNLVKPDTRTRVFECKTCSRKFPSFQALGGHRTSHKRIKLMSVDFLENNGLFDSYFNKQKEKNHKCSICGLEYMTGQALGGHMRRHRMVMTGKRDEQEQPCSLSVLKRSNSSKRVLCLDLTIRPPSWDHRELKLHQFL